MKRLIPHTVAARWPAKITPGRFAADIRRDSPVHCQIALLGLPDDTGVKLNHGRPGAKLGPAAFRAALARYGTAQPGLPRVFDAGDVSPARTLEATHQRVTEATAAVLAAGLFPIAIGGGHDLTFPFVRAVAARHPDLAGIYFDAHLDVRETRGSGMPFRKLVEECSVSALHLHGFRPLVNSAAHLAWFKAHGGRIYPDDSPVRLPSSPAGAAATSPRLDTCGRGRPRSNKKSSAQGLSLFVSFDLDVLDATHAPGVSALNPSGWSVRDAEVWVRACGADPRVHCFDLMELNPRFDGEGRTARIAAHLFLTFLAGFAQR